MEQRNRSKWTFMALAAASLVSASSFAPSAHAKVERRKAKAEVVSPLVVLHDSHAVDLRLVNDSPYRTQVRIRVVDEEGETLEQKKLTLAKRSSKREVVMRPSKSYRDPQKVRVEVEYSTICDDSVMSRLSAFEVEMARRNRSRLEPVFVSSVHKPCAYLFFVPETDKLPG